MISFFQSDPSKQTIYCKPHLRNVKLSHVDIGHDGATNSRNLFLIDYGQLQIGCYKIIYAGLCRTCINQRIDLIPGTGAVRFDLAGLQSGSNPMLTKTVGPQSTNRFGWSKPHSILGQAVHYRCWKGNLVFANSPNKVRSTTKLLNGIFRSIMKL